MKIKSLLDDKRIKAKNYLVELSIGDYIELAQDIMKSNIYQRKRVRSSKTVYTLLKDDLLKGCLIPPIVLALTSDSSSFNGIKSEFSDYVQQNKKHLLILDGLQRTYTLIDIVSELNTEKDEKKLEEFLSNTIRVELYVGLNRLGILYRMLTLNTGQTPMSLRQQIEILYLDYANVEIDGIELIREAEGRVASRDNQYNFRDIVEGFNAYLERNELPIDRANILDNISSLEKLQKENQDSDIFKGYLKSWNEFIIKVTIRNVELSDDYLKENSSPFGKTLMQVFKKSQAMSGFGAAIGRLKDYNLINDFDDIITKTEGIKITNAEEFLENINNSIQWIKNNTKKIGNAQRAYFQYFFREIYNPENDNFLKLEDAVKSALHKYKSQNIDFVFSNEN